MNVWLLVLSLLSGVVAGMGMGGGTLLIPVLTLLFGMGQHAAQGMNLLVFIPCAIVSLVIHIKNKYVNFKVGIWLLAIGLLGSVAASFLAVETKSDVLQKLFGGFLVLVGIWQIIMVFVNKKRVQTQTDNQLTLRVFTTKMFK